MLQVINNEWQKAWNEQMGMQKIYLWYSPIHCSRSLPNYDDF